MKFPPIPLLTELSEVSTAFLLGAGEDYVICDAPWAQFRTTNPLFPEPGEVHTYGSARLTAWVVRQGKGRAQKLWAPQLAPLSAVGLLFDLQPDRAAKLPAIQWRRFRSPQIVVDSQLWTPQQVAEALPAPATATELAYARVDEVKAIYGRMLLDVAYRIEYSALFDSAVPTTQRFVEALALWDNTPENTSEDELTRRASMVYLTFKTARAHAETVGLAHLPNQALDDARRAAKAARLAAGATSAAERDAALDQVIRILSSLALYYLPSLEQTRNAITRGECD